ncbi:TrkH family potassium uptake protein [Lachnoanaerobaculum saburreum]|uniref:Potassium uptake protein, TrkH family n=1 Tax=Lachnoanaerobaculum saburreum DSM 3986 TaxID=887325 RepID=E6LPN1_9FIRM|nr:potassium transporter TrkG [Lachnoanaerobaculum saburreum]EFU76129.1 potassium uptake protein, TrkH family [Lachnoanaerobaculum saburreum DSM 3986]
MKEIKKKVLNQFSSARIILFGFIIMIFLGASILSLPVSSRSGEFTPFIDALFTATSASCVTGLIVYDTATHWSLFGKIIIIAMIQCGGLGVVTMIAVFTQVAGKKIGLRDRATLQNALSAPQIGGIVKLTSFIFKGTVIIEMIGAFLMFPSFMKDFGVTKGIYYSIFHSISAFCNAGFDLMGDVSKFSSLTKYQSDIMINITIMLLILIGGLGFLIWRDVVNYKFDFKRYSTQTKIVFLMSTVLVVFPSVLFFFTEFSTLNIKTRVLSSVFQAVTPRTAGFNTIDYTKFSDNGIAMTIILMLIGGGSGSTAGGIKMTTIFILVATMCSVLKQDKEVAVFKKRIEPDIIKNAVAVFALDIFLFIVGSMIISGIEGFSLKETMFECASAVATVGLTLGITPHLGIISKILLICMMYIGRVGGITLIFAAVNPKNNGNARYPKEQVAVG